MWTCHRCRTANDPAARTCVHCGHLHFDDPNLVFPDQDLSSPADPADHDALARALGAIPSANPGAAPASERARDDDPPVAHRALHPLELLHPEPCGPLVNDSAFVTPDEAAFPGEILMRKLKDI